MGIDSVRNGMRSTNGAVRWAVCLGLVGSLGLLAAEMTPGLRVSIRPSDSGVSGEDLVVLEELALFIPQGQSPTVFLQPGPFQLQAEGSLSIPLRDDYRFRVRAHGKVRLTLGDTVVIDAESDGDWVEGSDEVRLKKGMNPLRLSYQSRSGSDARLQVEWASPDFLFEPVGRSHLHHESEPALVQAQSRREGRVLFGEFRCDACHSDSEGGLRYEAPSLAGIGARRSVAWLTDWIRDPSELRSQARMPKLFHGGASAADASAVAAFLVSEANRDGGTDKRESYQPLPGDSQVGNELFTTLNCAGCHVLKEGEAEADAGERISLSRVASKFSLANLVTFLLEPRAHYAAIRMPDFGLSEQEAADLAQFLVGADAAPAEKVPVAGSEVLARGAALVKSLQCSACHAGLPEAVMAKAAKQVPIRNSSAGCLAEEEARAESVPHFQFTAQQRAALRSFVSTGRESLERIVPWEEAVVWRDALRCNACHGELEGIPPASILGAKLKPEWMTQLLHGAVFDKPRPWLAARMPAYPAYANTMAVGLSQLHGFAGETPAEEEIDDEMAEIGRQLISPLGGFSCISCHGAAELKPTQVFESEGINFEFSAERLQKDYYRRWLLNPLRIDPATKMPVYFDEEGYSPLYDVLEGDTTQQLEAMWQYFRLGPDMVPPAIE